MSQETSTRPASRLVSASLSASLRPLRRLPAIARQLVRLELPLCAQELEGSWQAFLGYRAECVGSPKCSPTSLSTISRTVPPLQRPPTSHKTKRKVISRVVSLAKTNTYLAVRHNLLQ